MFNFGKDFENVIIKEFDNLMSGLYNSKLIIIGGRPAVGKTTLAINTAFNIAELFHKNNKLEENKIEEKIVLFFSLEMLHKELVSKIFLTQKDNQDTKASIKPTISTKLIESLPILIDSTPNLTLNDIKAKGMKIKQSLGIIVIDYLQLIENSKNIEEVLYLKNLADELNIPIVVLSQLNRSVENREDKKPLLSDFNESTRKNADIICAIFNDFNPNTTEISKKELELIILKS